jgi:translation initiation factor 3 subunit I
LRSLLTPNYSIAVHPAGTGYAIGGEDGYVRVHESVLFWRSRALSDARTSFDPDFFNARPYGTVDESVL